MKIQSPFSNIIYSVDDFEFVIKEKNKGIILKFLIWLKENYGEFKNDLNFISLRLVFHKTNSTFHLDYNDLTSFIDGYKSCLLE